MDFYTLTIRASHILIPSSLGAFSGAIAAYFAMGRSIRKVEVRYRGLTTKEWSQMAMSSDPRRRVCGYDGLAELKQAETLSTLFEVEQDQWSKFVCATYLCKLGKSPSVVHEFLNEFLFQHYGLCSVEEWEKMLECGIDLTNPKAYQRARMLASVRQRSNGTPIAPNGAESNGIQ